MKRKKIFYVPGIISLIGLPLLAFLYIPSSKPETVIKLFLPYDRWSPNETYMIVFSRERFLKAIISKKIVEIDLRPTAFVENREKENDKKASIYNELTKIKTSKDTNTVLKVIIGDQNTYGEFVWLVDQTLIHKINRWMFEEGDFYFLNTIPDRTLPETEVPMLRL